MQRDRWLEVGDRIFVRAHRSLSLNVGVVIGDAGILVFDTRESPERGGELRAAIARLDPGPVRWIVNSHFHWDHTFGNPAFPGTRVWGHPAAAAYLRSRLDEAVASAIRWMPELEAELADLVVVPPGDFVDPDATVDLGGRTVRLAYLGRGHTDSDIVMVVDGGAVVFAGDLVESSGPPQFGDAFPREWAATVRRMTVLVEGTVVPGHGPPMSRQEVLHQAEELDEVERICRAAAAGDTTTSGGPGPYPARTMEAALARDESLRA